MNSDKKSLNAHPPIAFSKSIPFFLVHLLAISAFFLYPLTPSLFLLTLGLYGIRMFGVTAGFHRYFSHRSYKTSRFFQFLLAFLAQTSAQKGALWWAAHHRHHHKYSDLENDIHSPLQSGFWWSHVGWILSTKYDETQWSQIPDFKSKSELRFLNRYHLLPVIFLGVILFLVGGAPALFYGLFVSTTLLWHGTFTINSLSHVFGWVRYQSKDTSKNNPILALITLGEGWHNNHHTYQSSTRQGFFWWEIDLTYLTLRFLKTLGIVWDLREPPLEQLERKRISFLQNNEQLSPYKEVPMIESELELIHK